MVILLAFHINISLLFIITLKCPWFITVDPLLSGIYYLSRKVYETFDSFLKLLFPLASHSLPLSLFLLIFVVCRIQTLLFGPCMLLGLFFTEKNAMTWANLKCVHRMKYVRIFSLLSSILLHYVCFVIIPDITLQLYQRQYFNFSNNSNQDKSIEKEAMLPQTWLQLKYYWYNRMGQQITRSDQMGNYLRITQPKSATCFSIYQTFSKWEK